MRRLIAVDWGEMQQRKNPGRRCLTQAGWADRRDLKFGIRDASNEIRDARFESRIQDPGPRIAYPATRIPYLGSRIPSRVKETIACSEGQADEGVRGKVRQ